MKYNINFKNNGKLRLLIIVGTRPEIIRLSEVIKKCRKHFDTILAHTGQNYDYTLNGIFFEDLNLDAPEVYLDCVGENLGRTVGNVIASSYELMEEINADREAHGKKPFDNDDDNNDDNDNKPAKKKRDNTSKKKLKRRNDYG